MVVIILVLTLFPGNQESATSLTERLAPVDLALVVASVAALFLALFRPSREFVAIVKLLLPPLYAIAGVSLLYSLVTDDSGQEVLVNGFAVLYLLVPLALLTIPEPLRRLDVLSWGVIVAAWIFGALTLLPVARSGLTSRTSALGSFENANHTSSWAVAAILLIIPAPRIPAAVKIVTLAPLLVALGATFSFAAVLGLVGAVAYILWSRAKSPLRRVLLILLAMASALSIRPLLEFASGWLPRLRSDTAIEKSSSARIDIWSKALEDIDRYPLGQGVEGALRAAGGDIHSDYVLALAAFGVLGVFLAVWLVWELWRISGPASKPILIAAAIIAATHSVFSWRYLWLATAIAIAFDVSVRKEVAVLSTNALRSRDTKNVRQSGSSIGAGVS